MIHLIVCASKRRLRRYRCERKQKMTQDVAYAAARQLNIERPGWPWSAYRCEHCGGWHVGHTPARTRQAEERLADR